MNRSVSFTKSFLLAAVSALATTLALSDDQDVTLEPFINRGISASGLHENQTLEDIALQGTQQFAVDTNSEPAGGENDVIAAIGGNRDDFLR